MSTGLTVAIAGATGEIGSLITKKLLSPPYHPGQIAKVKVITRSATSDKAKLLASYGAEVVVVTGTVTPKDLEGVNIVINTIGHETSDEIKNPYGTAAVEAGAKVYLPSEYGLDYRTLPVEHEIFVHKRNHAEHVRKLGGDKVKVVQLAIGFFMEMFITPYFGANNTTRVYESLGNPDEKVNLTGTDNIADTAIRTALLAYENPSIVPDFTRITGDSKSLREIAEIMSKHRGEPIEVKGNDWEKSRDELVAKAHGKGYILEHLNLLSSSGILDFKGINDNEIINPGEKYWKWKTVEDYAVEVKGRPPY